MRAIRHLNRVSGSRSGHVQWRTTCSGGTSSSHSSWGSRCWREPASPRGQRMRLRARPRRSGRRRLLPDGAPRGVRGAVHPGAPLRARVRDEGHERRSTAARSSCTLVDDAGDPGKAVSGAKDLIGKGYKILAGSGLVGRRAADGAARRAEQGPVHLRAGRDRRGDRDQRLHVPLGPADLPGRARPRRSYARRGDGQEGHRASPRTRPSARATSSRSRPCIGGKGAEGDADARRRSSATDFTPFAQQAEARRRPDLLFVAWAGSDGAARCGRRSTSRASSTRRQRS